MNAERARELEAINEDTPGWEKEYDVQRCNYLLRCIFSHDCDNLGKGATGGRPSGEVKPNAC